MTLKVLPSDSPWYAEGLNFECTGCGQCCTGSPGYIWVDAQEIEQMAAHLKLSLADFSRRYLRRVKGRFSLLEMPKTYDCVFLKDKKCQIYSVRPTQCRTFPWWPRHLKSEKEWKEAARGCEGIRPEASLVPFERIEEQRTIQEQTSPPYGT
jgi:Fe-S-cluster containining protein